MIKNVGASKRCQKCNMLVSVNATSCITCGQKIKMEIPTSRFGQCLCASNNKILLVQMVDLDGTEKNFCPDCIPRHYAKLLAQLLIGSGAHPPTQEIADRIYSLAGLNGRYRYSEKEKIEGLIQFIATIHSARERANLIMEE